jgi:hypothetical protein
MHVRETVEVIYDDKEDITDLVKSLDKAPIK